MAFTFNVPGVLETEASSLDGDSDHHEHDSTCDHDEVETPDYCESGTRLQGGSWRHDADKGELESEEWTEEVARDLYDAVEDLVDRAVDVGVFVDDEERSAH